MKPLVQLALVVFFSSHVFNETLDAFQLSGPKLSLDKIDADLGQIHSGDVKKIRFKLKNVGDDALHIFGVEPTCGCTTAKMPKSPLAPGESDFLEIEFNSSGMLGKVTKYAHLLTNDSKSQSTTLSFRADVFQSFQLVGRGTVAFIGNLSVGQQFLDTIRLVNMTKKSVHVLGVKAPASIEVKTIRRRVEPKDTIEVIVRVVPDKTGYTRENFSLEVEDKKRPSILIPLIYVGVEKK